MSNKKFLLKNILFYSTPLYFFYVPINQVSALSIQTAAPNATLVPQTSLTRPSNVDGDHRNKMGPQKATNQTGSPDVEPDMVVPPQKKEDKKESEPIVVTGTHIRGTVSAGAKVDVFSREDLERSGYATVHEFLNTLPQNFQGGGASEDSSPGPLLTSNQYEGTSVNLRGLGADSTLVLVNGRRVPASGAEGNFVDVSIIPQSAVERIEVLTDGASALYGADAIGGVVNFILRKDYSGAETQTRYGALTNSNSDEFRLAQTLGTHWSNGNVLVIYEYYHRSPLHARDRSFAATRDQRERGGQDYRIPSGNPGNILDPLTMAPIYGIPPKQNGKALTAEDLIPNQTNFLDENPNTTILPKQRRHSGLLTIEQEILPNLILSGDARYTERRFSNIGNTPPVLAIVPSSNPFYLNPFGAGPVLVMTSFPDELGPTHNDGVVKNGVMTAAVTLSLPKWRWATHVTYGKEKSRRTIDQINYAALNAALADPNPETALNPFGHGIVNNPQTIDSLRDVNNAHSSSSVFMATSIADGPLIALHNRDISAALGLEYRHDNFRSRRFTDSDPAPRKAEPLARSIYAAFAELYTPLIREEDNVPLLKEFDLSIAARTDKYSDGGTTTNPKVGARISTGAGISFHATYGTSYRSPNLSELAISDNIYTILPVVDSKGTAGISQVLALAGNNPDTKPEKAKTTSLGIKITPPPVPELTVQVYYVTTTYKDRISNPTVGLERMLQFDQLYPGLVIRQPTDIQLSPLCHDSAFQGNISQCNSQFIDAILDTRVQNISRTKLRDLDFNINYSVPIGRATLVTSVSASYLIDSTYQLIKTLPGTDLAGTIGNPADFRARGSLIASGDGITAAVHINYTGSYENDQSPIQQKISPHATADVNLSIQFNEHLHLSSNAPFQLSLSGINIFNNDPPFADAQFGYDPGNFDPLGRMISLTFTAKW